eukprot:622395_1
MEIDTQGANIAKMRQHQMKSKSEIAGTTEVLDLQAADFLDMSACSVLNIDEKTSLPDILQPNPTDKFVSSDPDVDEQLLFKISFKNPVRLSHLIIRATKGPEDASPPRVVKLYANQSGLDFSDAESLAPSQELTLETKHLGGEKVALKEMNFQKVTSLDLFVENNQEDTDITFVFYRNSKNKTERKLNVKSSSYSILRSLSAIRFNIMILT